MSTWLTSDSHFGHRAMAATGKGWRPFATVEEHDETLIENWNKIVKPNDEVWHLGDVGFGNEEGVLGKVQRLNGDKHLIAGNHDPVWSGHLDGYKHQDRWMNFFYSIQTSGRIKISQSEHFLINHFPYATSYSEIEPSSEPATLDDEWRETEYPGYHVNAQGQVRGRFGRVLSPWIAGTGAGYLYVAISGVGNKTVHALVCAAFHGPRPTGMQVAHGDGNNMNNRASNLRWATPSSNQLDKVQHGTMTHTGPRGSANSHAILTEAIVGKIRASEGSVVELAELYRVSTSTIRDILAWRTWKEAPRQYPTSQARYDQYRPWNHGGWLVHGHVHDAWKVRGRQINVGVDMWDFRPVHLDEITALIRAGRVAVA